MSDDIQRDPEFQKFSDNVLKKVVPDIQASGAVVSLIPKGPADIKFAVELGLAIMLDKPILALVQPGSKVPEKLVQVADLIVEFDPENPDSARAVVEAFMDSLPDE